MSATAAAEKPRLPRAVIGVPHCCCRTGQSPIGRMGGLPEPAAMTAVDFSAFVDQLATVSGETILPFFRTALNISDKGKFGSFDPVTAADHAAETAMRNPPPPTLPPPGPTPPARGEGSRP